jgi:cell wall-associated NlpC family hydrolase
MSNASPEPAIEKDASMTDAIPPPSRRRNAFRPDLADAALEGRVASQRFVEGVVKQVRSPSSPVRSAPDAKLGFENEVLFGETVRVFDEAGTWAWIQIERDRYVGYVPSAALSGDVLAPTHNVKVPGTFIYPDPDIKRTPLGQLSLNAAVTVTEHGERFAALATGGYVIGRHLRATTSHERDFVEVAERLIYAPYLWGGRTRTGLDCSGLVQLALEAAGHVCPRDTDMQVAEVGTNVLIPGDLEGLLRGDLVFWPGHVGIMLDSVMLIHANGHHMAVAIEPLSQAVRRISKAGGGTTATGPGVSAIKRLEAKAG